MLSRTLEPMNPRTLQGLCNVGFDPHGDLLRIGYVLEWIGGCGVFSREIVSFVRAYARSSCVVELELNRLGPVFSFFPFLPWGAFLLFFLPWGASLFPFGALSFLVCLK